MIYFASDFHLGVDLDRSSKERERMVCAWLDQCAKDAEAIYLLGDLFDFWFEYQSVIPRGYARLIGKMAELSDRGIDIHLFTGNHDMWMFDYFEEEMNVKVYREPVFREIKGKRFLIGHGDGLGPGDKGYKRLKKVFRSPASQWLFARLHPNFAFKLARFWSGKSRSHTAEERFLGPEKEWLVQYCEQKTELEELDYCVFGHRHIPIDCVLSNGRTRYINLGDWMYHFSYGRFDGYEFELKFYLEGYDKRLVKLDLS